MTIKFNFLFILLAIAVISCNSSKKNVEKDGSQEYSNFQRVGSVDTMQDAEVLPGNIKSTDAYISTVVKGMNHVMREVNEGGVKYSYILGGKGTSMIKTSVGMVGNPSMSTDIYRKDGKLIYAATKEIGGNEVKFHRYYFENDRLVHYLLGSAGGGDNKSPGGISYKSMDVPAGKEAELKNLETKIQTTLVSISPFIGRVTKKGEGFVMTTCFNDKDYTISDKNGFLMKSFSDHQVEPGGYLLMSIRGVKDDEKKMITVQGIDSAFPNGGSMNCF